VFCACEIIELLSVVFYVVKAVHMVDFKLVINKTPNKQRLVFVKKLGHVVIETHVFWTGATCFPTTVVTSVTGLYPRCAGQMCSVK
jgi:hypothetical protein